MPIPLSSLPMHYQDQAAAQLARPGKPIPSGIRTAPPVIRQQAGDGMNKTERAFHEHLKAHFPTMTVHVQGVTLKLGNGVRYTPDFYVEEANTFWEVKGFMRDDAAVKIKVAARTFKLARFFLVTKSKGGGWNFQEVRP